MQGFIQTPQLQPTAHVCQVDAIQIIRRDNPRAMIETLSAIHEMARVVKPGGLVVAIEPKVCSPTNDTPVLLDPMFRDAGLTKSQNGQRMFSAENKTLYLYFKPEDRRV